MKVAEREKILLDFAADTRKFEISLFWQRSLFFWGFISASFVAFAALYDPDNSTSQILSLLISCFGLTCSVAWTLVNRGSKYWQENWEQKLNKLELQFLKSTIFRDQEPIESWKSSWLCARRFSVSKISIALSDFTIAIWLAVITVSLSDQKMLDSHSVSWAIVIVTIIFIGFMVAEGRSSKRKSRK